MQKDQKLQCDRHSCQSGVLLVRLLLVQLVLMPLLVFFDDRDDASVQVGDVAVGADVRFV
jgi:hypothetical protein